MTSKLSDILKLFAWSNNNPKSAGSLSATSPTNRSAAAVSSSKVSSSLKPKVIKLNFRDICVIDEVSPIYHEIQELALNHNCLVSLDGIEQFTNLRSLQVNFNKIRSPGELAKIRNPHLIRELSFKGNPNLEFQSQDQLTEWAISVFPNVALLNGKQIQEEEVVNRED